MLHRDNLLNYIDTKYLLPICGGESTFDFNDITQNHTANKDAAILSPKLWTADSAQDYYPPPILEVIGENEGDTGNNNRMSRLSSRNLTRQSSRNLNIRSSTMYNEFFEDDKSNITKL